MFGSIASYVRQHHVGALALFVAMSGTAYAATLPRNSVGTAQLKRDAVTTKKVKNASLLRQDFKSGQLPAGPAGAQGVPGPQGGRGDQGAPGAPGTPGTPGSDGASVVMGSTSASLPTGLPGPTFMELPPSGHTASNDASDGGDVAHLQISPNATMVLRDLFVQLEAEPPGVDEQRTFTLTRRSGTPLLGCSVAGAALSCNSGGAAVTLPPGTEFLMKTSTDGSPASSGGARWSFRALTP